MRRTVSLLAAFLASVASPSVLQAPPSRIHVGDLLTVYVYGAPDMTGNFTVQSDGAIYVPRAGRLVVNGLTIRAAQESLLVRLRLTFKDPTATISIKTQREPSVYVVGGTQGVLPLNGETDLRQVYAASKVVGDPDLLRISVFRNGARIATMSATDLTSGRPGVFTGPLSPNDLVVFEPKPFIRVYVVGTVRDGGMKRLNEGDDVYRAIAAAGDVPTSPTTGPVELRSDYVVTIRRGTEVISVPLVVDPKRPPVKLENGDLISVQPPTKVRVTFTGEAKTPGEAFFKPGTPLAVAVGSQGGAATQGSLRNVIVFHNGVATFHDLSPSAKGGGLLTGPILEDGDVVYIPVNERAIYVFGSANRPGRIVLQDDRLDYRLADAVAEAGGVATGGTLTRVSVGRPGADGKLALKTYRLDKFVKSGDVSQNPALEPDDVVYIDSSRGVTANTVLTVVSSALLLNSLRRL